MSLSFLRFHHPVKLVEELIEIRQHNVLALFMEHLGQLVIVPQGPFLATSKMFPDFFTVPSIGRIKGFEVVQFICKRNP